MMCLSPEEETYFIQCVNNGTFGDLELNELRRLAGGGKISEKIRNKAIFQLFITPKEQIKINHPVMYYSLILRPLYHIVHSIKRLMNWSETKSIIAEYKRIN